MRIAKTIAATALALTLLAGTFEMPVYAASINSYKRPHPEIKSVIVMIPDGMSDGGVTLARWYKSYASGKLNTNVRLAMDEMASGRVRTFWRTPSVIGAITDSAPAGSAMATGYKTNDKHISVSGDEVQAPYATILEAAKTQNKATGLIATSNIQHATPAAFSSHYFDRSRYDILGEQQVYQNMDVVLGSGSDYLTTPYRKDKENMVRVLKNSGYQYITTKNELNKVQSGKVWGMFAGNALAYHMDRALTAPEEPSLRDMTSKAIQLLSKNKNGFFLMVEGSKIDWAAHANDPMGIISDVLAFDDAVAVALDYAKEHNDTMVVVLTDHANGGITIGDRETTDTYSKDPVSRFLTPLRKATLTGEGVEKMLNKDRSNIKEVLSKYYGINDLTDAEVQEIRQAEEGSLNYTVGPMLSKRANIGWTSGGHTGEDITLYTYLPGNNRITGLIDNTDIAKSVAAIWDVDLDELTEQLFCNANEAFAAKSARVQVDLDSANPTMTVKKGNTTVVIEENKNYILHNDQKIKLESVIVQTNGIFYVPQRVINLVK